MRYVLHPWGPELVARGLVDPVDRLAEQSRHYGLAGALLGARLRDIRWSSLTGLSVYRLKVPVETS